MQRAMLRIEDVFANLPNIETERLLLRKMRIEDAQDLFEYARDQDVARYTTWAPHSSVEDSKAYLRRIMDLYAAREVSEWGLVHKADARLIGTCGFIDWTPYHARAEVGYAMSQRYWGQGIMTEAVREVIRFGFEVMMLNRVEARCIVANIGSARVMEKCGMSYEGILREHMYAKGHYDDLKMYSILRKEWQPDGKQES